MGRINDIFIGSERVKVDKNESCYKLTYNTKDGGSITVEHSSLTSAVLGMSDNLKDYQEGNLKVRCTYCGGSGWILEPETDHCPVCLGKGHV